MFIEHWLRRLEGEFAPENLAYTLYFHSFRYIETAREIIESGFVFSLEGRGAIARGTVFNKHAYLVFLVPAEDQNNLFEPARSGPPYEEKFGVWGLALKTPVPVVAYPKAEKWLTPRVTRFEGTGKEIPLADIRCLPATYLIAGLRVDDIRYEGSDSRKTCVPVMLQLINDIPNKTGISATDIARAMAYYRNPGRNDNQRR